jgi:hypothetical protein
MFPQKKVMFTILAVLLFVGLAFMQALPVRAASSNDPSSPAGIIPTLVAGNPTLCAGGVRFNNPVSGTYPLDAYGNTVTIQITDTPNGPVFTWTVSPAILIDTVVAKGGNQGANIYDYTGKHPRPSTDGNLHSPTNAGNDKYAGLSHIDFCFHYQLTASKTAAGSYDRTITWDLVKSVTPATHSGFVGADVGTSTWTVKATKDEVLDNYKIAGIVTVNNPTPYAVTFTVADQLNDGTPIPVNCLTNTLAAGETTDCPYELVTADASATLNTATITVVSPDQVAGTTTTVTIGWTENVVGDDAVTVDDDRNPSDFPALISATTSWSYDEKFTCSSNPADYTNGKDEDQYTNTATATGATTDLSADAAVTVTCYAPVVSKTADTRYARDWTWTIEKTANQTELTLADGQTFAVTYAVTVSATYADSNFEVYGTITVNNPNPDAAMSVALTDSVDGTAATIEQCTDGTYTSASGLLTIPAGATAVCAYIANLGDVKPADSTNTATVTLNDIEFPATDGYAFSNTPTMETDECVTVADDYGTPNALSDDKAFGNFCATVGMQTTTFSYTRTFGPYTCGNMDNTYEIVNIASFETNDNHEKGNDDHTVKVTVPACQKGCTLTQGYWKTHSKEGPAPYDDAWKNVGALEEDKPFFLSNQTWYQVFWTAPAGNVYYNLAHQYMAVKLNILNGAASTPAVTKAITDAEALFATYTPAQAANLKGAAKKTWTDLASLLAQYNNGLVGPGHCSEIGGSDGLGIADAITTIFLPIIAQR